MQDDLIGFVLGALDDAELSELRRRMEEDPDLRRRVQRAEQLLRPLVHRSDDREPPAGLAERTCQYLWAIAEVSSSEEGVAGEPGVPGPWSPSSPFADPGRAGSGRDDREKHRAGRLFARGDASDPLSSDDYDIWSQVTDVRSPETEGRRAGSPSSGKAAAGQRAPAGPQPEPATRMPAKSRAGAVGHGFSSDRSLAGGESRTWVVADFVVAAGVCLAAACLFFPAVVNSRYTAQMIGCQNNQRELAQSLIDYSMQNNGYFPQIPADGNTAAAGLYAVALAEKGMMPDERQLLCPAKGNQAIVVRIPRMKDLLDARGPQLVSFHRTMGGDYAYNLGYLNNGRLQGVRNQGRSHMALLADAPIDNLRNVSLTNHLSGQNVVFEDGHVKFLTSRQRPGTRQDDLFLNAKGQEGAGLHAEDVVLGGSAISPLPVALPESMIVPTSGAR